MISPLTAISALSATVDRAARCAGSGCRCHAPPTRTRSRGYPRKATPSLVFFATSDRTHPARAQWPPLRHAMIAAAARVSTRP